MTRGLAGAFLFLGACSSAHAPAAKPVVPSAPAASSSAAQPDATSERLAANSPRTTAGGATFTAPAGWTLRTDGDLWILEGPEPRLRVGLLDVVTTDADSAVAAAWLRLEPGFKWRLKLVQPSPGRDGWEEDRLYTYEMSPNEKRVVFAGARHKGRRWVVLLFDAGEGPFQRRRAEVRLISSSLRPQGYTRESFKGRTAHALDASRIRQISTFVERSRSLLGVPGVAMTLVQNGHVVLEQGFGVRELGKRARVDPDTLFMIASDTKALTTLLLAKLVDQGKLGWETPVTKVYPTFKLGDAETTRRVLIKHLVCACTGMPRQDLQWMFEFGKATPKSALEVLADSPPTTRFGDVFQYSNTLAAAAGYVAAYALDPGHELGVGYDEAMRSLVFAPLGMKQTTFDFTRALHGNHAAPHAEDIDGKISHALMEENYSILPLRPAGGAWSSARELTRYVQMELAGGKLPDGARYLSEANLLARRAPQVAVGEDRSYGMGLVVDNHFGIPMVVHDGSLIGYRSVMFWLPEQGVGGVMLTNADMGGVLTFQSIRKTLEVLFDGNAEAEADVAAVAKNHQEEMAKERARLTLPADPAWRSRLAGRYVNAALGEIAVQREKQETIFDFGEWRSAMASRQNDDGTVSFVTIAPGMDGFAFVIAEHDGKRRLLLRDAQHEYEFTEAP
jgi:CubicO group peptidase (beta-lactamase class C family)